MSQPSSSREPTHDTTSEEVRKKLRDEIGKLLVLAIPAFAIQQLLLMASRWITDQPWRGAILLLPVLAASVGLFWLLFRGDRSFLLRGGTLYLFGLYCLVFTIAAGTDLLSWRRDLLGYEEQTPRGFLGLNRLGDWRYRLFGNAPEAQDLLVITVPTTGRTREAVRFDLSRLIRIAAGEARGIVLDFRFSEPSLTDPLLCAALQDSATQNLPIFLGYGHKVSFHDIVIRETLPLSLRDCIPMEHLGHIAGYQEMDGRVRMVPLFLKGDHQLRALSLRAASFLVGSPKEDLPLPYEGLLQPLQPRGALLIEPWPVLETRQDLRDILRDHFVFVGSSARGDRHDTPYGPVQGVVIHAWATHALRTGLWVRRVGPIWSFPGIWLLCYILIVLWVLGARPRRILLGATLLSFLVVSGVAIAAMFRIWIDAIYPITAIWPLACILAFFRRRQNGSVKTKGTSLPALGKFRLKLLRTGRKYLFSFPLLHNHLPTGRPLESGRSGSS
jgi:CHASE2 domain-containing sensor protein